MLDRRPIGLPDSIQEEGERAYARLLEETASPDAADVALINYGKKTWAYRQAEEAFETTVAPDKREQFFLSFLSDAIRETWEAFVSGGGSIHDFRHGESFEASFTPQENVVLEQASVEAGELVHEYLGRIAREEEQEQYENMLAASKKEQRWIEEKITELRSLIPKKGKQWDAELEEAAVSFERGLADVEERPTVANIQAKIDWYQGQVEAGNG